MSWRQTVESTFAGWPATERSRAMQEIAEENDHAERLGYTCHPDDRRGFGKCYFMKGNTRVWHSPDGWAVATGTGQGASNVRGEDCLDDCDLGHYESRSFFHTLDQALRGEGAFLRLNRFGRREG